MSAAGWLSIVHQAPCAAASRKTYATEPLPPPRKRAHPLAPRFVPAANGLASYDAVRHYDRMSTSPCSSATLAASASAIVVVPNHDLGAILAHSDQHPQVVGFVFWRAR